MTAKSCKKCGGIDLYADGRCRPCENARLAAYRLANPDKTRARYARYYAANKEKVREYAAKNAERRREYLARYRAENAERLRKLGANYYLATRDKQLARSAKYRAKNAEKARAVCAKWRAENPERARMANAAWLAANPNAWRTSRQNRRARTSASAGTLSRGLAERLLKLQRGRCACCRKPLGDDYHLDHIVPLALGGSNTDDNIQLLRSTCNQQKHAKHPVDFMQQRGFLL